MTQHWELRRWLSIITTALSTGLLIALASTALAACGYNSSNQNSPSSTQSQPQATHPPVKVQNCGIVQGLGTLKVPPSDTGAQQAENCFWHAFQQ